jgi:hypothetical protein
MDPLPDADLDAIAARAAAATPGPWYWTVPAHTGDAHTAVSGALRTHSPAPRPLPDGTLFHDPSVLVPMARLRGDPDWLERFHKANAQGQTALQVGMECFAREEDKAFIAHARADVPALLAEVRRLRQQLAAASSPPEPEPPG